MYEPAELIAERLDGLRLSRARRAEWGAAQVGGQGLRHGEVAAVGDGRGDEALLHAEVLETVVELRVGHVDGQLLEHVGLARVEVEAHLAEPLEALVGGDALGHQAPSHGAPVHVLVHQVLQLLSADGRLLEEHQLGEHPQEAVDGLDGLLEPLLGSPAATEAGLHLLRPRDGGREDDDLRRELVAPRQELLLVHLGGN